MRPGISRAGAPFDFSQVGCSYPRGAPTAVSLAAPRGPRRWSAPQREMRRDTGADRTGVDCTGADRTGAAPRAGGPAGPSPAPITGTAAMSPVSPERVQSADTARASLMGPAPDVPHRGWHRGRGKGRHGGGTGVCPFSAPCPHGAGRRDACDALFQRLHARLRWPAGAFGGTAASLGDVGHAARRAPFGDQAGGATADNPAPDTADAAAWLRGALAVARHHARDGSWLHDANRLAALAQLNAMARCLAARDRRP